MLASGVASAERDGLDALVPLQDVWKRDEDSDCVDDDVDLACEVLDPQCPLEQRLVDLMVGDCPLGGAALLTGERLLNSADSRSQLVSGPESSDRVGGREEFVSRHAQIVAGRWFYGGTRRPPR